MKKKEIIASRMTYVMVEIKRRIIDGKDENDPAIKNRVEFFKHLLLRDYLKGLGFSVLRRLHEQKNRLETSRIFCKDDALRPIKLAQIEEAENQIYQTIKEVICTSVDTFTKPNQPHTQTPYKERLRSCLTAAEKEMHQKIIAKTKQLAESPEIAKERNKIGRFLVGLLGILFLGTTTFGLYFLSKAGKMAFFSPRSQHQVVVAHDRLIDLGKRLGM